MSYGFDENMGKVPIEPILNTLEQNYQSNVNTIYNTIKNQGTTPAGKTPAQIATAINSMASAKFNAGRAQGDAEGYARAQNVSWSQSFYFEGGNWSDGGLAGIPNMEVGLRNVTSGSITGANITINVTYHNSAGTQVGSQDITGGSGNLSIPSTAQKMKINGGFLGRTYCTINLNYKCQVLR